MPFNSSPCTLIVDQPGTEFIDLGQVIAESNGFRSKERGIWTTGVLESAYSEPEAPIFTLSLYSDPISSIPYKMNFNHPL